MRRLAAALVGLVITAAIAGLAGFWWLETWFARPGPLAEDTVVIVPRGAGVREVADRLGRDGVVAESRLFALAALLHGESRSLKAGEYRIPARASARAVLALLITGRTVVHRLTVPEGLTSAEVVALLRATEALHGTIAAPPPEGSLLPETYHFSRGDERAALLDRMAAAMAKTLAELWAGRAPDLPLAAPREAVVLASIVEKETGRAGERAHIAGVFVNRLRRGMRLQSDPTVAYGLSGGKGPLGRPLTKADLEAPNPYNTYLLAGLPPTPIANPGREAIAAVLNPLATDDLYFVADGSGGHAFARSLAEHNRNVARWRRARRAGEGR